MKSYYFDSSGLVKNYVQEEGTEWVQSTITAPENLILVSKIAGPEVISALTRRRNRREINEVDYQEALLRFEEDWLDQFVQLPVSDQLLYKAMEIIKAEGLRAYDAVQLATALRFHSVTGIYTFTFVSSDSALCSAAEHFQLQVINPQKPSK